MRSRTRVIPATVAFLAVSASGDDVSLTDRGLSVAIDRVFGTPNSDAVAEIVRVLDNEGRTIAELPPLIGPIHVSDVNGQIFACESNAIFGAHAAKVFDLEGTLTFSFTHRGYLRDCGLTPDARLYWLHYKSAEGASPLNVIVVLDSAGRVVAEERSVGATEIKFEYGGVPYDLSLSGHLTR